MKRVLHSGNIACVYGYPISMEVMNALSCFGSLVLVATLSSFASAVPAPCDTCLQPVYVQRTCVADDAPPSWIFRRSTYTHDPMTGARVAQYMRIPPVEPLEDERNVTSRYRRSRTNLRGADGSVDSYYEVQAWGNGRGGLDAEWERFHDAWKESILQGGYYNQNQSPGYGGGYNGPWGYGNGYYGNGYGGPGYGNGYPGGGWGGAGNWGPGPGGPPGPGPHPGGP
jgi:hypothetical protein